MKKNISTERQEQHNFMQQERASCLCCKYAMQKEDDFGKLRYFCNNNYGEHYGQKTKTQGLCNLFEKANSGGKK